MNIVKNKSIELFAKKAGKREPFHFKPIWCPHWDSLSAIRYDKGAAYNCTNFLVPMKIQVFWLWFYFELNINREKQSDMKMVMYNETHYAMIDEVFK